MLFLFVEHVDRGVVGHEWVVIIGLDVAVLIFEIVDQHLQIFDDFPLVVNRIIQSLDLLLVRLNRIG